jgi:hypothetical protein
MEAEAGQVAGHQVGGGEKTGWRAVSGPKLGGHDECSGRQVGRQTAGHAGEGHRCPRGQRRAQASPGRAGLIHAHTGEHDAPAYRLGLTASGGQHGEVSHDPTPVRNGRGP